MNLHEYQAKELLKKYNVPVQEGIAVDTVMAAEEAYRQIKTQTGNNFAVIKAQIHAGGRGRVKLRVQNSVVWPWLKVLKMWQLLPKTYWVERW